MTARTAAWLAVYALERMGVRHTFGIPGVHNTELYDELARSELITPVLVAHEGGAAFMADAISRTGRELGTLVVVPAAGLTHAASGIAEAFLDGVPMLVISGGIRRDTGRAYQLHDMDQHGMLRPITKKTWLVRSHADVVPTLFEAYRVAHEGVPGPVFVELPVDLQITTADPGPLPERPPTIERRCVAPPSEITRAAALLRTAKRPGIFCGWGAIDAHDELRAVAEQLGAPVAVTLQGLSAFSADHPLHAGFGLGPSAVPSVQRAFEDCDALLAVGVRFAEIPTGSFGYTPPENLVHVDIDKHVFDANYPARVALEGDAREVLVALSKELALGCEGAQRRADVERIIAHEKKRYIAGWHAHDTNGRVSPARFFEALRKHIPDDAIVVADDGNHTFLAAELMPIHEPRSFFSPSDFNCMGYCVPAVIGAKLVCPDKIVVGIVGDGALRMTGLELLTASANHVGAVFFVFDDGELAQIAQAQETPYNRKTCSVLAPLDTAALARAVGVQHITIHNDAELDNAVGRAVEIANASRPVLVDVHVDYSKRTQFTEGAIATNLRRMDLRTKARFVSRAVLRKITG